MGVRVNGIDYYVRTYIGQGVPDEYGDTDFDNNIVSILGNISEHRQKQTFWHELMHILVENEKFASEAEEEAFVGRVANILYAMFVENQILEKDWWTRVLDEEPDYSVLFQQKIPRVAARGRSIRKTDCKRKK